MGIYGALSTAVTGLSAQSYALENISGNIANSQTVGYKRVDTSFADMIPDSSQTATAGSVKANAVATNNVAGSISTSQVATNMAINGSGFFVVKQNSGSSDNKAVFSGATYYTRQGDFELNKDGYLVNSSGYYLEGLSVDPTTGNVSGSVPNVIQISNSLLPAQSTTQIDYQLNLPELPLNGAYQSSVPGSELLNKSDFLPTTITTSATAIGSALTGANDADTVMQPGQSLTVTINGASKTFDFYDGTGGAYAGSNIGIDVQAGTSITTALGNIQTQLQGSGLAGAANATVALDGTTNKVTVTLGTNLADSLTIADTTTGLGLGTQTVNPTGPAPTGPVNTITAAQNDDFLNQSIAGGAVTAYAANGSPADVVFRWVKTASTATGGQDTWNLYYTSNSTATGSQTMWTKVNQDFTFGTNGSLNPAVTSNTISGMTVDGVSLGNIKLSYGTNGITQFGDANGAASVTTNTQNGYAAGKFSSVAVDNSGRVIASYSNGMQVSMAQVVTANFNGADSLKQMSGDAFAETSDSGSPIISSSPTISGSSLEASNTDISTEFSHLIVTQQAYAAGTKIVTTANQMLQQAINMIQ